TGGNNYIGFGMLEVVHPLEENFRVKGNLGEKDDVGTFSVIPGCQTGGSGQPACMTAHDFGYSNAPDVVYVGVTDHLLQDGGNVLCGAAITGSVVGEHKVVVNGLGNPNKTDGAVDGHGVGAQLGNGVH